MNIDRMQSILMDEINEIVEIRDNLTDSGRPLSPDTKTTLRRIFGGRWLSNVHKESQMIFMEGNRDNFVTNFEETLRTLEDLI